MCVSSYFAGTPIPPGSVVAQVVLGVIALVAALGMWGHQRWTVQLVLVMAVATLVLGGFGLIGATSVVGKAIAAFNALLGVAVLLLLGAPSQRGSSSRSLFGERDPYAILTTVDATG